MEEHPMIKIRESNARVSANNTTTRNARSREEVAEEILNSIESDPVRTHCMYQTHTSHKQLVRYLNWLQRVGLIESKNGDKNGLFLTEKGKMFCGVLRNVNAALRTGQLSELDLKEVEPSGNRVQASEYKKRSGSELICDILSATQNDNLFTRIMYAAGISQAMCKSKLNMLEKCGFVEKRNESLKEDSLGRTLYHGQTHTIYHNTKQGELLRVALEYINSILYPARSVSLVKIRRT